VKTSADISDQIAQHVEAFRRASGEIFVALVVNIKQERTSNNCSEQDFMETEYFSDDEAAQLLMGINETGAYCKIYFGELDFINSYLSGKFDSAPRQKKVVWNLSQTGTGVGRKSLIPAFCRLTGIPFINSDAYVVSLARHKYHIHLILKALGVPTPTTYLYIHESGWHLGEVPNNGDRVIAKACHESASIGLSKTCVGRFSPQVQVSIADLSKRLAQPVIVQEFIAGYELETPIIELTPARPTPLGPVAISIDGTSEIGDGILDYDRVLNDDFGFARPHNLPADKLSRIRHNAGTIFQTLGIRGIGRVDVRVSASGEPYVTDVSTSPHLVTHSSFFFTFAQMGLSHSDLLATVLAIAARKEGWI